MIDTDPSILPVVLLAFVAGMCVPFRFGIERLRGFGRATLGKLPYEPPEEDRSDRGS